MKKILFEAIPNIFFFLRQVEAKSGIILERWQFSFNTNWIELNSRRGSTFVVFHLFKRPRLAGYRSEYSNNVVRVIAKFFDFDRGDGIADLDGNQHLLISVSSSIEYPIYPKSKYLILFAQFQNI